MQWLGVFLVFAGLVQLTLDMLGAAKSERSFRDGTRGLEPGLGGAR